MITHMICSFWQGSAF